MATTPNPLEGAKKALEDAQKFTQSVEGKKTSTFAPHEFSNAPYSMVRGKSKSEKPAPAKEKTTGEDIAAGLEAKKRNVEEYQKALGQ